MFEKRPLVEIPSERFPSKSSPSRRLYFSLLLVRALSDVFDSLIPAIKSSIAEKSNDSSTKIDTLNFLNLYLCSHEPQVINQHLVSYTTQLFCSDLQASSGNVGSVGHQLCEWAVEINILSNYTQLACVTSYMGFLKFLCVCPECVKPRD